MPSVTAAHTAVVSPNVPRTSLDRPLAPAIRVTVVASPSTLILGNTTNLTALVSGGTPEFSYRWAPLPQGCVGQNYSSLNCTPTTTGSFAATVTVTDSTGRSASNSTTLLVLPVAHALRVAAVASPSTLTLGNTTNLTALVTGGTPYFSFRWAPLPPGCSGQNFSSLDCTPDASGSFTVTVTVTDGQGQTASNSTTLVVQGASGSGSNGLLNPATLYLVAGIIGIVAAVATAVIIVLLGRRQRRPPRVVTLTESPYVPPPLEEQP